MKEVDIYDDINTIFERKSRILVTIATMLQFGMFLIALIGLVIKLIDLGQKNNHSTYSTKSWEWLNIKNQKAFDFQTKLC